MGLRDLIPDDAGDNRGGRPKEKGGEERRIPEHNYRPWEHGEEYWQDVWDRHVDGEDPTLEEISAMVGYSCVFPWDLKIHIESHGIYEFDWDHMPDDYPSDDTLANWLRDRGVVNDFTQRVKARREGYSEDSGLFNLVENAKTDRED